MTSLDPRIELPNGILGHSTDVRESRLESGMPMFVERVDENALLMLRDQIVQFHNVLSSYRKVRVGDFATINPPKFHGSKIEEDHQEFIDDVLIIMGLTLVEKAKLPAYHLNDVAQV
uniref:Gag-pol polyprotein n=1 Tax=Solanum tuberosum TaxID=4113 RepID=M1DEW8_SOLTU